MFLNQDFQTRIFKPGSSELVWKSSKRARALCRRAGLFTIRCVKHDALLLESVRGSSGKVKREARGW